MNPTFYLDTEFTDLQRPELLSLGLVTFDGHEHYAELDLADAATSDIVGRASDFVVETVLGQWDRVPGAGASRAQMGQTTARWLLNQLARVDQAADVAVDHPADFHLLEQLLRETGQWDLFSGTLRPLDVSECLSRMDGALGACHGWAYASRRGLERHHALADAHALRAACHAMRTGKRVAF